MSAVTLPQKAGFVPTTAEWDQLVRIAENLAAQLVHRDVESLKATFDAHEKINQLSGDLYGAQMALAQAQAERDAARAEVARLTWSLTEMLIHHADNNCVCSWCSVARSWLHVERGAALRQPASAQGRCFCGHTEGLHDNHGLCGECACDKFNPMWGTAPAGGEARE